MVWAIVVRSEINADQWLRRAKEEEEGRFSSSEEKGSFFLLLLCSPMRNFVSFRPFLLID